MDEALLTDAITTLAFKYGRYGYRRITALLRNDGYPWGNIWPCCWQTIGIFSFSWIVVVTGLSKLPEGCRLTHIAGVAMLAGIGFTMSIFIGSLAFADQPELLLNAKIGIVLASLVAGIAGYVWLLKCTDENVRSSQSYFS